jgi:TolA-binding protein
MTKFLGRGSRPVLALVLALAGTAVPALAQDSSADARLRRLEAEVRDLRRAAGTDKTVAPQAIPTTSSTIPGTPATTPVSDLLARMESIENQLARLTAQNEEGGNKLRLLEERVAANEAAVKAAAAVPAAIVTPVDPSPSAATVVDTASSSNLSAMAGSSPAPRPARAPAAAAATPAPAATRAASTRPVAPSAQRVAAVRAVVKPDTGDAAEDEYTYGFRLWEAKFYPEAQQQLKLFIDKYPRSTRVSYARNLMGRALLEEGKPRDAASWFLQNYQANKQGERAPDSLLFLGESMSRMKDSSRACIALAEFAETYPREAAGRLKSQYDATRGSVKCN